MGERDRLRSILSQFRIASEERGKIKVGLRQTFFVNLGGHSLWEGLELGGSGAGGPRGSGGPGREPKERAQGLE